MVMTSSGVNSDRRTDYYSPNLEQGTGALPILSIYARECLRAVKFVTKKIPAAYIEIGCRECLASATHLVKPRIPKTCHCKRDVCADHCGIFFQFCYVYFSCSKIELFRSKLGIAFSSVFKLAWTGNHDCAVPLTRWRSKRVMSRLP